MKFKKLPRILPLSSAIAAASLLSLSTQVNAINEISQSFESIRETIPAPTDSASSYFVRIGLDPVTVWMKKQKSAGLSITEEAKQTYITQVKAELQQVMDSAQQAGYDVISPVVATDVGFTVFVTKTEALELANISKVQAVIPKPALKQQRTYSTSWIGGDVAHQEYNVKGAGQTIAIIDTGVDYFHSDFLGSGDPIDFLINDPAVIEPGTFPTATVVGGYDFAGYDYDARYAESSIPSPDPDPVDDGIHGSHVAGIAAGRAIGPESATGIAPEASILAYKVFGAEGSTTLTSQAIEMAIDPNGDGDPSDAVDVINMSLGSIFGSPDNSTSVSAQNAVEAGTVVVASAGNSGNDIPYISGAPGSAEGVIAVASSIPGGVESFFLSFSNSFGDTYEFFAPYAAISPPLEGFIEAPLAIASPYDACSTLSNSFEGGIALITRGSCSFTIKLENAAAAGASAAVVVNNEAGAAIVMGGTEVDIPGAMVSQSEGSILLAELSANSLEAEFAENNTREDETDDDTISTFSSRGPGPTGLFKPDVTAPGDQIESAYAGTGSASLVLSGTSMAAPQVAGMAALLKEQFPDLGPRAIKAIIQNTAQPAKILGESGTPPLSLQGTGIVDIEKALNATAYAAPGGIGFGVFKPEYNASEIRSVEITNFSDQDQRFSISLESNLSSDGVVIDVPSEVFVAAGQTANVPMTLRMQANQVGTGTDFQEFDGWVIFSSDLSEMRVGYTAVVEPASLVNLNLQGSSYNFQNTAFGAAEIYSFTATDSSDGNLGFKSLSDEALIFAFNADTDWTQFAQYAFIMSIDTDEDGQAEYQITVADLNTLAPSIYDEVSGVIASAIDNLETGGRSLLYLADVETNNSVLQFLFDAYGDFGFLNEGDTNFDYTLSLQNLYAEESTLVNAGSGTVELSEENTFEYSAVALPGQEQLSFEAQGPGQSIFFIPTQSTPAKRVVTP